MRSLVYRQKALADIAEACAYSEKQWGSAQRERYEQLIAESVELIAHNPYVGKARPEIDVAARSLFIQRPGRRASHVLYYFIGRNEKVYVVRLLHASQDFEQQLSAEGWQP